MAWITCPSCGSKHSSTRACPRCASRKEDGRAALWWAFGALLVLILWRTAKGLQDADASGDFSGFWSIFFGG